MKKPAQSVLFTVANTSGKTDLELNSPHGWNDFRVGTESSRDGVSLSDNLGVSIARVNSLWDVSS